MGHEGKLEEWGGHSFGWTPLGRGLDARSEDVKQIRLRGRAADRPAPSLTLLPILSAQLYVSLELSVRNVDSLGCINGQLHPEIAVDKAGLLVIPQSVFFSRVQ